MKNNHVLLLTARLQAGKTVSNPDGSFVKVGGIVHGADMIVRGRRVVPTG